MKKIEDILTDFNRAIGERNDCYDQCLADIEFGVRPGAQWSGSDRTQFENKPKPENNKIVRSVQRIVGQFSRLSPNAKIVPSSDDADDESAEILQGRWRNDFNNSDGVEAYRNAFKEAAYGGFGAFKLFTEYEDEENPDPDVQRLCVEPIYSAASSVVFNSGAVRKDKSDAKQCWHLVRVNRKEIEEQYDMEVRPVPEALRCNDWDWQIGNDGKDIYVAYYYEIVEKTLTDYVFPSGEKITRDGRKYFDDIGVKLTRDDAMAILEGAEYETINRKVKVVERALISGDQFIEAPTDTAFKRIPVVPVYGYHIVIDGIEFFCGEVAYMRDPQRFENMVYSSIMEIAAQPQIEKPYFAPEQIKGHEAIHAQDPVKNYPYLPISPMYDKNGNLAATGPVGYKKPPSLGSGLSAALQYNTANLTEQAGTGQSTLPANTSGAAIQQVNERMDDRYQELMSNATSSIRAACEAWIPAAQRLYFTNARLIRVQGFDGSFNRVQTLDMIQREDGAFGPYKNTAKGKYDVIIKLQEGYKTQKQAELEGLLQIAPIVGTDGIAGQLLQTQILQATTFEGGSQVRKIARYQELLMLVQMGIEPEYRDDDEREWVFRTLQQQQAQAQAQQQQAAMLAQQTAIAEGQARIMEGQAAIMNEQNDARKNEISAANTLINQQKVENDRTKLQIEAEKAGADIRNKQADTAGKVLDNVEKLVLPRR